MGQPVPGTGRSARRNNKRKRNGGTKQESKCTKCGKTFPSKSKRKQHERGCNG